MHLGLLTCMEEADLFIYFNMLLKIQQTLPQSFFPICAVSDGSYLTSSGTAYWVDQKGAVAPGSATGVFQGSQSLLIGCVQSSTPALLQMMSDFTQYADA